MNHTDSAVVDRWLAYYANKNDDQPSGMMDPEEARKRLDGRHG